MGTPEEEGWKLSKGVVTVSKNPLCMDSLTKVSTLSTKYSHAVYCLLVHKDVLCDETTLIVCDTPAHTIVLHCYT